jgi:tetratricopeptide (TPR) repeat protein
MTEDHEMHSPASSRRLILGTLLILSAAGAATSPAAAQQSRMRVVIPAFEVDNPRSRAGVQLAEQIRRQINQLPTHAPADARAIRNAVRQFNLREDEMTCTQWLQLTTHINAALVLCGSIDESTQRVKASFMNLGGDAFDVPECTMQSVQQAAEHVVQAFSTYVRQLSLVTFCDDHIQSESWSQALDACDQAIELNPSSVSAHYRRGSALNKLERPEDALAAFETVLRLEQLNQDAMLHAGILAARLERQDEALAHFHRYLELNPGNVDVRLTVATDLANAGDPAGALKLVEEAMDDPEARGTLWEYAGHFAVNAGIRLSEATPPGTTNEEAARYYRTAIRHYNEAVARRGDSLDVTVYSRLMLAHHRTGDVQRALEYGQQATTRTPDDAQVWMMYAEVLGGANRVSEALQALDRVATLKPDMPSVSARRAVLLLDAGRLNESVAMIRAGLERGDLQQDVAEQLAQQMAVRGYQHTRDERLEQALPYLRASREIGRTALTQAMANFFEGWNLIKQGAPTLQAANANAAGARRVKPLFERAVVLLEGAGAYTEQASFRTQLLQQARQFIEVADALIRAGR